MRGVRVVVISCVCTIVFFRSSDGGEYPDWIKETLDELNQAAAELGASFPKNPQPLLPGKDPFHITTQPIQPIEPAQPPTQRPVEQPANRVTEPDPTLKPDPSCPPSISWANGKRVRCRGEEIFYDGFGGLKINRNNWTPEIFMPVEGFMVLQKQNAEIVKGKLHITPTLNTKVKGIKDLEKENCTKSTGAKNNFLCYRVGTYAFITPPVSSARILSKTSFKYGTVEIRAKLPVGDWIVTHIALESKIHKYGANDYDSGRIVLVKSRGNQMLRDGATDDAKDISNKAMESLVHLKHKVRPMPTKYSPEGWGEAFHNYKLEWRPDSLAFYVDDIEIGKDVATDGNPYYKQMGIPESQADEYLMGSRVTPLAPFDEEFYIILGVDVGGLDDYDFPDNCRNGRGKAKKPWDHSSAQAHYQFWRERDTWSKTWTGNHALEIEHIKITAL